MSLNSRTKGASGERELICILQETIDRVGIVAKLERNLEQTRYGGADMVGLSWLSGEVKRCEVLQLNKWWNKLVGITKEGQVPAIFYRRNKEQWKVHTRVRMKTVDGKMVLMVGSVDIDDWLVWFENELRGRSGAME